MTEESAGSLKIKQADEHMKVQSRRGQTEGLVVIPTAPEIDCGESYLGWECFGGELWSGRLHRLRRRRRRRYVVKCSDISNVQFLVVAVPVSVILVLHICEQHIRAA